jgi:hypothetical protein
VLYIRKETMKDLINTFKTVQKDVSDLLEKDRELMSHSDIKYDEGYLRALDYVIKKLEE